MIAKLIGWLFRIGILILVSNFFFHIAVWCFRGKEVLILRIGVFIGISALWVFLFLWTFDTSDIHDTYSDRAPHTSDSSRRR